ncbi:MAG: beta-propeller domain-containing protein, partial [Clostridiales Family XIII bacterium]|nr:beta-propeller domain-containing protein [Clostridiales Family XIII bacterium]
MSGIDEKEFKNALKSVVDHRTAETDFFKNFNDKKPDVSQFFGAESDGISTPAPVVKKKKWRNIGIGVSAACVALFGVTALLSGLNPLSMNSELSAPAAEGVPVGLPNDRLGYVVADADYGNIFKTFEDLGYQNYRYKSSDVIVGALNGSSTGNMDLGASPGSAASGSGETSALAPADMPVPSATVPTDESSSDPVFSDTNIQTLGVQEADVIKTDGKYIYAISSQSLSIVLANDGNPELLAKIPQPTSEDQVYFEMYITADRIIALRQGYSFSISSDDERDAEEYRNPEGAIIYPGTHNHVDTGVDIFDIRDPRNPKKIGSLSQSGDYADSRMIGD